MLKFQFSMQMVCANIFATMFFPTIHAIMPHNLTGMHNVGLEAATQNIFIFSENKSLKPGTTSSAHHLDYYCITVCALVVLNIYWSFFPSLTSFFVVQEKEN